MFIELTRRDGSPLLINTDQIVEVTMEGTKGYVGYHTIVATRKGRWDVRETYEEVKDILTYNEDEIEYTDNPVRFRDPVIER